MTGLRQGELLGLRWRDVDFKSRRIRVVTNYVRGEFDHPKSEESARSVPMGRKVEDALTELRSRSLYAHERDLVFAHPETGKPLDRSKLSRRSTTDVYMHYAPSPDEVAGRKGSGSDSAWRLDGFRDAVAIP